MTTKEIEDIAYHHFAKTGWYGVFEMAVPRSIDPHYHRERVDLMSYETTGIYRCYEIKNSVSDFNSGCAWSFFGHYNYFILNSDIYESVKDKIPDGIGVWLVFKTEHGGFMRCEKKPKRRELLCDGNDIMFAMMQALSREYAKYRKILKKQRNKKK